MQYHDSDIPAPFSGMAQETEHQTLPLPETENLSVQGRNDCGSNNIWILLLILLLFTQNK